MVLLWVCFLLLILVLVGSTWGVGRNRHNQWHLGATPGPVFRGHTWQYLERNMQCQDSNHWQGYSYMQGKCLNFCTTSLIQLLFLSQVQTTFAWHGKRANRWANLKNGKLHRRLAVKNAYQAGGNWLVFLLRGEKSSPNAGLLLLSNIP